MKALLVHPGTQHSFALAQQLQRLGCLSRFWTGFAYLPGSPLGRGIGYLPPRLKNKVMARSLDGVPAEKLRTRPYVDLSALRRLRSGYDEQSVMFERNRFFQETIPEEELAHSDVVIGVDTASWLLAERASALGRSFILDRTTGHPRAFERLVPDLRRRFPQWMEDSQRRLPQLSSAEEIEHRHARWIAVGSSFARRTLVERGVPKEKILIIALGTDLNLFRSVPRPDTPRPLRFVFVGFLSAAKGVPLLLDAWHSLGNVDAELWLVGSTSERLARLIPPLPGLRSVGRVAHSDLPAMLCQCDVLVLPSYFEGFGAVLLEAMAAGLPIIATDSTAAPDLITDGVEGYVIPTGNGEALRDAIKRFIGSPDSLVPMSRAARRCAERYSWDAYGDRWIDILRQGGDAEQAPQSPAGNDTTNAGAEAIPIRVRPERTKVLLVHPGTQYSFRLARQLERHGCLHRFWTGIAYVPDSPLGHWIHCLPQPVARQLSNRCLQGVPSEKTCFRPFGELRALYQLWAGRDNQRVMYERNAAFQRMIPGEEIANSSAVIGFDTSSWLLAEKTVALGRRFILDQSSGHPLSVQKLMRRLREQFPEWAEDFSPRFPELLRVEELEHRVATRIVVASSFSRRTLIENGVPVEKIVLNPYGVDLAAFVPVPRPDPSRPLRFIFVGSFSAGKGVPLLLQAWRSLKAPGAELWLAGPHRKRHRRLIPELPGLRVVGKVPHRELPALLRQCDVLVLPSYFEGFGLVLLEALAAGMPIIASDATAAPDLITAGVEGYLVPVGDVDALREAMNRFVDSPNDLASMTQAARLCAERYSWDAYGDRWVDLLHQVA